MPKERSIVEAGLEAKGFTKDEKKDHRYYTYVTVEGKKTAVFTKTSHGSKYKTLDDSLLLKMAKQCKLTKAKFVELVDCPLSRAEFEKLLAEGDHL